MPESKCLDAGKKIWLRTLGGERVCACFECIRIDKSQLGKRTRKLKRRKKMYRKIHWKKIFIGYYFYSEIWMISHSPMKIWKIHEEKKKRDDFIIKLQLEIRTSRILYKHQQFSTHCLVAWRSKRTWKQRRWQKNEEKNENKIRNEKTSSRMFVFIKFRMSVHHFKKPCQQRRAMCFEPNSHTAHNIIMDMRKKNK